MADPEGLPFAFWGKIPSLLWSLLGLGCISEEKWGLKKGHGQFAKNLVAAIVVWCVGNQEARRECWTQGSVSARPTMSVRFRASKHLKWNSSGTGVSSNTWGARGSKSRRGCLVTRGIWCLVCWVDFFGWNRDWVEIESKLSRDWVRNWVEIESKLSRTVRGHLWLNFDSTSD